MHNVSKAGLAGLLLAASLAAMSAGGAAWAQGVTLGQADPTGAVSTSSGGNAMDTSTIPESDMAQVISRYGLIESKTPSREFIKNWHRPKKIVVLLDNNVHRLDWLREVVPADIKLVGIKRGDKNYAAEIKDTDAIIGCQKDNFATVNPGLEWLHHTGTGIDQCFTAGIVPPSIRASAAITNSARLMSSALADDAVALMMALSRGLDIYIRQQETMKFTTEAYPRMWTMPGRTVLIVGLGGIGTQMALLCHGLGMHVIANSASIPPNAPDFIEHIGLPPELGDQVGQADVVMTALPLTPATNGMFNAALFAKFKKGAIFVNVTRGEEQVDADLVAALKSGQVGSTGQDVVAPDSPLWKAPNTILTPHVAAQDVDGAVSRTGPQMWDVARDNLRRFIAGDKMLSVVDPDKG